MNKFMRSGIFVLLVSVVVAELLALSVSAKAPELKSIQANSEGTWYINAKTMVNSAEERISLWSKVVPEKSGIYYGMLGMALEKVGKNPLRLEYVQILHDVDCSTGKVSSSNVLFYDKLDRIMHTVNMPGSVKLIAGYSQAEEGLLAEVCKQHVARLTGE
jgi:hypothetical protein